MTRVQKITSRSGKYIIKTLVQVKTIQHLYDHTTEKNTFLEQLKFKEVIFLNIVNNILFYRAVKTNAPHQNKIKVERNKVTKDSSLLLTTCFFLTKI